MADESLILAGIGAATGIVGAATGIIGTVTGVIAIRRDRPYLRLKRRLFDEKRLKVERPDMRERVRERTRAIPLNLEQPFFCITAENVGLRSVPILEAHVAFHDAEKGLRFEWHSHWFRSVQTLQIYSRDNPVVLTETKPTAKLIFPAGDGSPLAFLVRIPGRTCCLHPSWKARLQYWQGRRKWRRFEEH